MKLVVLMMLVGVAMGTWHSNTKMSSNSGNKMPMMNKCRMKPGSWNPMTLEQRLEKAPIVVFAMAEMHNMTMKAPMMNNKTSQMNMASMDIMVGCILKSDGMPIAENITIMNMHPKDPCNRHGMPKPTQQELADMMKNAKGMMMHFVVGLTRMGMDYILADHNPMEKIMLMYDRAKVANLAMYCPFSYTMSIPQHHGGTVCPSKSGRLCKKIPPMKQMYASAVSVTASKLGLLAILLATLFA